MEIIDTNGSFFFIITFLPKELYHLFNVNKSLPTLSREPSMDGLHHLLARINLSEKKITRETIEDNVREKFLGGTGLGVDLLCKELPARIDPLGPQNEVIIAIGPLNGTIAPTSGRFSLITKSPLTGTITDSNSGGFWGQWFKTCGFDAIVIQGREKVPSYILIEDQTITFKDASELWGKDVNETTDNLQKIEGKNARVLCIGPAGENLAKIASIMNDKHRAFGRGGVGAVLGSKKLKAIVVKPGKQKVVVADPEKLKAFVKTAVDKIIQAPITGRSMPTFGTAGLVNVINTFGLFPINNHQFGSSPLANKISGEAIRKQLLIKEEACFNCPIGCGRLTKTSHMSGKGPEYESVWALGADCGVFDLEQVAEANYECNRVGLDTISTGVTIACAMELNQRGLINEGLNFGDGQKVIEMVAKMARREGFGADLAEGSWRLASKYNTPQYAMCAKKQELPAYDPRGAQGQALAFATSNRGGCHLRGFMIGMEILGVPKIIDRFKTSGKADILVKLQNGSRVTDSLVTCKFQEYSIGFDHIARFMTATTGQEYSISKLDEIGERIWNLERLFNIREGFGRKDDTLPERFLKEPLTEGPSKGNVVRLEEMLNDYYVIRGWDEAGIPRDETLKRLGLRRLS